MTPTLTTVKMKLDIPTLKLKTLVEHMSLNALEYLTYWVFKKRKLEQRQAPILID